MKFHLRSSLALLVLVGWCGVAGASTLVENCTTASGATELSTSVLCAQFNIAGQTVTAISIEITGGISGTLTMTNNSATTQTFVETTTTKLSVGPLAGFTITNPIFTESFTTGPQILNSGETLTNSGLSDTTGDATIGPNATNFAPYVGAGNFTVPVSTATSLTGTGGGGQPGFAQSTTANATAQVTFTYTLTPPP